MELSPLQLIRYWVDDIEVHANRAFDPEQESENFLDEIKVGAAIDAIEPPDSINVEETGPFWMVSLTVDVGDKENVTDPYTIQLNLSGIIQSSPHLEARAARRAVNVNGPSMLFGIARELVRAATARGPYPSVLLPSLSFLYLKDEGVEKTETEEN